MATSLPDVNEESFAVEIEGVGMFYDGFESYRINSSYTSAADSWEFVVFSDDDPAGLRTRWRPWQLVRLYISGACQIIGRIDRIQGTGTGSTRLKVSGRDYLADLVDGNVDPSFQVSDSMTVGQFVLDLFKPWGITGVLSDGGLLRNLRTGKAPYQPDPEDIENVKLADFKASDGEGVFEYANKLVMRQGWTIQPSGTRTDVLIIRPQYKQPPIGELTRPGTILEGTADRNYTNVPTVTLARGRAGGKKGAATAERSIYATFGDNAPSKIGLINEVQNVVTNDTVVSIVRETRFDPKKPENIAYGSPFPVYKPLFYRDADSRNGAQTDRAVRRMIAERLRETLQYQVTVRGHTDNKTGAVYTVDTILRVDDGIEDVRENLWVLERTLYNDGGGPMTDMTLVRPESYVY